MDRNRAIELLDYMARGKSDFLGGRGWLIRKNRREALVMACDALRTPDLEVDIVAAKADLHTQKCRVRELEAELERLRAEVPKPRFEVGGWVRPTLQVDGQSQGGQVRSRELIWLYHYDPEQTAGESFLEPTDPPGPESDAALCRTNDWEVGTYLAGDEGYGETVIQITAIGECKILARQISHRGAPCPQPEGPWTLEYRDWRKVEAPSRAAKTEVDDGD